jgi:arabinose-5-phosphate isomerase
MHKDEELPLCSVGDLLRDALPIMNNHKFGCIGVKAQNGNLVGMITDGDLRRHLGEDLWSRKVEDIMTNNPTTIHEHMLAAEVIELINTKRITAVFVVSETKKPLGLIHIHDLLREGVS